MQSSFVLRRTLPTASYSLPICNRKPCKVLGLYPLPVRNYHQSVNTGEVVLKGCDRLPDLTWMWPFHMWPSDIAATLMDKLQVSSGMPWWATVLAAGLLVKVPVLCFNIYNLRKIQRFFVTSPRQLTHFTLTYFNNLVTKGEIHALKMANDERRFTIYREGLVIDSKERFQPTMFTHVTYIPLYWIAGMHASAISGIHWMNRIQYVPLTAGGLSWCPDLTAADPYMILPLVCVATGILNLYLHPMHWLFPLPDLKPKHILLLSPVLAVGFSLLSSLSADMVLYITSANVAACFLNTIVLRSPKIFSEFGLLSSGEALNRVIPPASTFYELSKSLERQKLLLQQKREQAVLRASENLDSLQPVQSPKLLSDNPVPITESQSSGLVNGSDESGIEEVPVNLKFVKTKESQVRSDKPDLKPHLNVKKVFDEFHR